MQPHRQRRELADRLLGPGPRLAAALAGHRSDDLREQADLAFGRRAERAQVPAFEAEPGQVGDDLANRERVVVVVAAGPRRDQPELLELAQLVSGAGRPR